ncbi:MBL fold hydrolase [Reticulibacter mediterranei]|uniref:MBL fold hydrolase n=1 Tax=Reticulibacter mediterranei TaxID=2778369 RepID=A0A8J3IYM6_9CHLR|nr:MBL fold metallo-hydrolase [Reticulibacter mediterranei]GHO99162.1 MBL fold hydrolase [Reticulibacter mediterranei]
MVAAAPLQHIQLDTIRVTYVPDGYAFFSPTDLFPTTTLEDWQSYQRLLNASGQLVSSVGAYIIQTRNRTILVDAGYGPGQYVEGSIFLQGGELLANLKRMGLILADIDSVFFTHLHSDHVNGIGQCVNAEQDFIFSNARLLVRRAEWQRFANPAEPRADVEDALKLLEPRIELIEEGEMLAPEITVLATPGHTSGHTSLVVSSGAQRAILLGDTFHSIVQIEHPTWTNSFDHDPKLAKVARQHMLQELAKPETIAIGTHLADSVFGRVTLDQGRYQWHTL